MYSGARSVVRAAQTIDGDEDRGPSKDLHQPVEQPFVVVMSWLKIFFKNVLGFTNGANGQFLIAHLLGAPCNCAGADSSRGFLAFVAEDPPRTAELPAFIKRRIWPHHCPANQRGVTGKRR